MGRPKLFSELGCISEATLGVLQAQGFERTTPVQEATIPLFAGNKDVAVDACTGSGKTLAFVIPVIERLRRLEEPLKLWQVGAVIVSPTRELAAQIHAVAEPFLMTVPGLRSLLLTGGSDPAVDVARFKESGAQLLIGTPGRISDVMQRCGALDAKRVEVLVLDEADRLLEMGFRRQLDAIMARLPRQRRTGLFSATQTEAVAALARAGLRNPVRVNVAVSSAAAATQKTPTSLDIQYLVCESTQKLGHLLHFLQEHREEKVMVYFLTCACVDYFGAVLPRLAGPAGSGIRALHGRMKQAAREATLAAFTAAPAGCLLCTDVAARGLDIPDVHWVLQFDPPQDPDAFVHRVGRTARIGKAGRALVFLLPHETAYVDFLRVRKVPLTEAAPLSDNNPSLLPEVQRMAESDRDLMEKGTKAFVSYVRGYKEHSCTFIFRLAELDLGALAHSLALLRLPRMPEIKHASKIRFTPSSVDPDSVKYADKAREKQRRKALQQRQQQQHQDKAEHTSLKGTFGQRGGEAATEKKLPAAKRRQLDQRNDEQELAEEYKLLRKLKKGKIDEHEFDVATGLSDDELEEVTVNKKERGVALGRVKTVLKETKARSQQQKAKHQRKLKRRKQQK